MVEGDVLGGARLCAPRRGSDPDSHRQVALRLAALHRADLPGDRNLRAAAALDCARLDALLRVLPGFVHLLRLPLHREVQWFRLGDFLGQRSRVVAATGLVPALRSDFPGETQLRPQTSLGDSADLSAGPAAAEHLPVRAREPASQRDAALEPRPAADGISRGVFRGRRRHSLGQLPAGGHANSAATVEVGDARHHSGDHTVHAVLCHPVPHRIAVNDGDEGFGVVAGSAAFDLRIRHLPLPPDGRRSDFQARHGVHAGGGGDCGSLLRGHRRSRRIGAHADSELGSLWPDPGDRSHGALVRSGAQMDSGPHRSVFLPNPV